MDDAQVVAIIAALMQLGDRLDPDLDKDGYPVSGRTKAELVRDACALLTQVRLPAADTEAA